jgi:hypothetical protein
MKQLTFSIKEKNDYNRLDYILSDSNKEAYNYIVNSDQYWGINPYNQFLMILGPKCSGKTYLAKIWADLVGADTINDLSILPELIKKPIIIDDIDQIIEENKFFHFFNEQLKYKNKILLTCDSNFISFKLLDLDSRIKSINRVYIREPDEEYLKMIITKLFSDRSIKITNEILNYLIYRLPRNYEYIYHFIKKTDDEALVSKRDITIPLLSKILDQKL